MQIDITQLAQLVGTIGFPAAMALFLAWYLINLLPKLELIVEKLDRIIDYIERNGNKLKPSGG